MLDRERHHGLMKEARDLGARIMLISDGDVNPAMECCIEGSGVHMVVGTGGAPEGVLAAAALKVRRWRYASPLETRNRRRNSSLS